MKTAKGSARAERRANQRPFTVTVARPVTGLQETLAFLASGNLPSTTITITADNADHAMEKAKNAGRLPIKAEPAGDGT